MLINKNAIFVTTSKTYDTVKLSIKGLIDSRVINTEEDLNKIENAVDQGDKALNAWRDALVDGVDESKPKELLKKSIKILKEIQIKNNKKRKKESVYYERNRQDIEGFRYSKQLFASW
tara:strand:- start:2325 stop:2678 length:354 start_codon:yes stop_codon:yes gene_type:complete